MILPRLRLPLLLLCTLALASPLALLHARPAIASTNQYSIMMDDDQLVYGTDQRRDKTLKEMKSMGVEYVRVTALWSVVANGAKARGRHFDPRNPASYPHRNWDRYDNLVRSAERFGIGIYFDVTGPGPRWAHETAPPRYRSSQATWKPKPDAFYDYVYALGKRYSGTYRKEDKDRPLLPRVRFWSLWNEPNQGGWLTPQYLPSPALGTVIPYSPILYRRLYLQGRKALGDTGHGGDAILIGETAPLGGGSNVRSPVAPKLFIRELMCADSGDVPYTGAAANARDCSAFSQLGDFKTSGWAHHPYTKKQPPTAPPPSSGDITISNIVDLPNLLDDLSVKTGHIASGLGVVSSEFGWETSPPDRFAGIPLDKQAEWLNLGDFLAFLQPRVYGNTQFLMRDVAPDRRYRKNSKAYWHTYQSGLLTTAGRQKPAYAAYELPFLVFPNGSDPVTGAPQLGFWGQLRFRPHNTAGTLASADQVQLEFQPVHATTWQPLGAPVDVTSGRGFFSGQIPSPGPGLIRAGWKGHALPFVAKSRAAAVPTQGTGR
jgi:hypothetical protein